MTKIIKWEDPKVCCGNGGTKRDGKKKALLVVGGEVKEIYWNMKLILI
jgi:hypothetical protein